MIAPAAGRVFLPRIEADEKGTEALNILETVRDAGRNVKDIAGLQGLL
jgi:hypothetical protein